ncbi:MAG: GNAT family N-acetyltransferase [Tepidanaerobacteraceae bacterium]|jgi:ribosomal protein S18 acetylase RimI-like enzyme
MIKFNCDKKVDIKRLKIMFNEVGWNDKTKDVSRLKDMITNSQIVVTAWDGELMIGFARCVTDHVFNGQINNVVVDSRYRGKGIGKELIIRIIDSNSQVTYVLRGDPENVGFYKNLGFKEVDSCLVFNRCY